MMSVLLTASPIWRLLKSINKYCCSLLLAALAFTALPSYGIADSLPQLIATIRCDTTNTLFGTRIVALGDQNNDGFDDILTWDFRFKAFFFHGGNLPDTIPYMEIGDVNSKINNIGDVNGDSYSDITALGRAPLNWKLGLYYGGPNADTLRDAWFGVDSLFGTGFATLGCDINSNNYNDLITQSNSLGGRSVLLYELGVVQDSIHDLVLSPQNVTGSFNFGNNVMSGDFNGDGDPDLAISLRRSGTNQETGAVYLYWGSPSFDTIPNLIINRPNPWVSGSHAFGEVLEFLGDFNGDGFDDFLVGSAVSSDDTLSFIYFGGPSIDTIPDLTLTQRITHARSAGDINKDSFNDLIASYPLPFSNAGEVIIYFGGPTADNIPDILIRNSDMPQLQFEFGMDCSGVGDVNDDGVDDFAFSAIEGQTGTIYIYSGTGIPTGIVIEHESTLPSGYHLSQNYPNPFNPLTVIEFSLPTKNHVTLTVFNVIGEEVSILIDKFLMPGEYQITWDGTKADGTSVASGVYVYRLKTMDYLMSKKMILLK